MGHAVSLHFFGISGAFLRYWCELGLTLPAFGPGSPSYFGNVEDTCCVLTFSAEYVWNVRRDIYMILTNALARNGLSIVNNKKKEREYLLER